MLEKEDRSIRVLTLRSDMTGADRAWAARYEVGDVLHYFEAAKRAESRPEGSANCEEPYR